MQTINGEECDLEYGSDFEALEQVFELGGCGEYSNRNIFEDRTGGMLA